MVRVCACVCVANLLSRHHFQPFKWKWTRNWQKKERRITQMDDNFTFRRQMHKATASGMRVAPPEKHVTKRISTQQSIRRQKGICRSVLLMPLFMFIHVINRIWSLVDVQTRKVTILLSAYNIFIKMTEITTAAQHHCCAVLCVCCVGTCTAAIETREFYLLIKINGDEKSKLFWTVEGRQWHWADQRQRTLL